MLYERWLQIADQHRGEIAVHDPAAGQHRTFGELADEGETAEAAGPVAFPQGRDFIPTLLGAWRRGQIACPLEPGQPPPRLAQVPDDCAHLKLTSATTGDARLVVFTGAQLAADAAAIVAAMGLRPEWPNVAVISLAHSYGFSNLVLPLLLHGIPLILADSPMPEGVRRAAASVDAVTLPAVPALWRAWHGAGAIPANVRLGVSAGAPLSLALEAAVFAGHGLKLHNFYGSSECGGIAYDASSEPRTDATFAGRPLPGVKLSTNAEGCLEVRGPAVGRTYWPEASPGLLDGRFQTSDLAELVDGGVHLRGRAGDQIHIAGRKISPESIERVLLSHPGVRECLVFGAPSPDSERTDNIIACIAARSGLSGESLKQFLLEKLPAWQIPREWIFVERLEANGRGKLSRSEWRRNYLETAGSGAANGHAGWQI